MPWCVPVCLAVVAVAAGPHVAHAKGGRVIGHCHGDTDHGCVSSGAASHASHESGARAGRRHGGRDRGRGGCRNRRGEGRVRLAGTRCVSVAVVVVVVVVRRKHGDAHLWAWINTDMSLLEASEDELLDELERELAEDAAGGGGAATAATPTAAHTAAAAPVPAPAPARASATATPLPAVATPVAAAAPAGSDAHLDDLTKRLSALGVSNAATTSDAAPALVAEGSSSSSRGMMPTAEPA